MIGMVLTCSLGVGGATKYLATFEKLTFEKRFPSTVSGTEVIAGLHGSFDALQVVAMMATSRVADTLKYKPTSKSHKQEKNTLNK